MSEPIPGRLSSGPDAPTPEQVAVLQYLGLAPVGATTRERAAALIARTEADPAGQEKLRAWERDKHRLHPELFAPPQRSYREARWWQARISADTLYGYSFQQPSLDQTFVILAALDRQEPGWDRHSGDRRETRFMNELATLSPELCKPGCVFPHDLPAEDAPDEPPATAAPPMPVMRAPSAPDQYTARSAPFVPSVQPAWQPPVQPPAPARQTKNGPAGGGGRAWKWALPAAVLAAGAGAYLFFGFHPPMLERGGANASTADAEAAAAVNASQQRAMAKYPDLARAGSPLNARFVAAFRQLEAEHDPLLQQSDWPERLAARCADVSSPSPAVKPGR